MTQESTSARRRQRAGLKPVEPTPSPSVAADTVATIFGQGDNNLTTLRNGTVIRLKAVPPHVLREVAMRIPETPVPVYMNEEKGREEPNPNDPDYLAAEEKRLSTVVHEMQDAMILLGVEVVSVGDCPAVDDDSWVEELQAIGIYANVATSHHRKLDWMRYVALSTEGDIAVVVRTVTRLSGITEFEVFRAARAFRGDEERGADRSGASPATG